MYVLTSVKGTSATTVPLVGRGAASFRVQIAYQMFVRQLINRRCIGAGSYVAGYRFATDLKIFTMVETG